ncbi:hypothetical protein E2C01_101746 [Portunus trituberculatus]|uniref:Secreted protein n=1 Tax=Portunus trituberculatus TaxID=210409 RepID=A0A5B7KAK1_PORTR|nr:hypothetical protein [Portunus trituberculatus]
MTLLFCVLLALPLPPACPTLGLLPGSLSPSPTSCTLTSPLYSRHGHNMRAGREILDTNARRYNVKSTLLAANNLFLVYFSNPWSLIAVEGKLRRHAASPPTLFFKLSHRTRHPVMLVAHASVL